MSGHEGNSFEKNLKRIGVWDIKDETRYIAGHGKSTESFSVSYIDSNDKKYNKSFYAQAFKLAPTHLNRVIKELKADTKSEIGRLEKNLLKINTILKIEGEK